MERMVARRNAFTLVVVPAMSKGFIVVEFVVVIGIIAVLTAILMPPLRRAREEAMRVQCMSNLRQVHLAFGFYAHDFNDNFPWPWYWYEYLGDRLGRPEGNPTVA